MRKAGWKGEQEGGRADKGREEGLDPAPRRRQAGGLGTSHYLVDARYGLWSAVLPGRMSRALGIVANTFEAIQDWHGNTTHFPC